MALLSEQIECCRLMHCSGREERVLEGNIIQYLLEDRVWIIPEGQSEEVITDRRRFYSVLFNTVTKDVSCDCRKFETFGILCRHIIRVYDQNLVHDIPSNYVLQRWRKDVPRKHTRVKVSYHDPTDNVAFQMYNKIMVEFEPICKVSSCVEEKVTFDLVISSLQTLRLEVQRSRDKFIENQPALPPLPRDLLPPSEIGSNNLESCHTPGSVSKPVGPEGNPSVVCPVVKDPISRKKPRGRPKGSRPKSLAEMGYKKTYARKGEMCSDQPSHGKLPTKRKKTLPVQHQNTIEDYYEYVEDFEAADDILQRNGVGWSVPSETF